jgi:uncharacterized membrane protein
MTLLFAFLIGLFAGLRALTPPAVTAWAVHFRWLKIDPTLRWMGSALSVLVLTMLAITELIYDKRPDTPSRTAPAGLIGRIVTGGLCGACVATAGGAELVLGAMLGVLGGVIGCFGGYQIRSRLVKALGVRDIVVALIEDLVAVGGSLIVVSRF